MTTYAVAGMSCQHCVDAVTREVTAVPGVTGVRVDLAAGTVEVAGTADDAAVRAAIDEAGYEVR
jgi:copper chaperone